MEIQFQYITKLAVEYKLFTGNPSELFRAINQLSEPTIQDIYNEYNEAKFGFQPVNLLRAEIARQLLDGNEVSEDSVEQIKNHIRQKDTNYFSHLPAEFLRELEDYRVGKRDMFANWQKSWNVFHVFLYRGKVRETVQLYLEQLCRQLATDLQFVDYASHTVDFYGASNFGSDFCWLSLYPRARTSHKEAYQFHLRLDTPPEAGMHAGWNIKNALPNLMLPADDYESVLRIFNEVKPKIVELNKSARNYFKFAPGEQASRWDEFREASIIAVNYDDFKTGDISEIQSREELNVAVGLPAESLSNETWNLWLFKTANQGDIAFANKGKNTCIGIGVITGDYYYDETVPYSHRREVEWITGKVYQYQFDAASGFKNLFRPDTFAPTLRSEFILSEYVRLYPELAEVFDRHDLKYNRQFEQIISGAESKDSSEIESETLEDAELEISENRAVNFWWLNANPSMWSISDFGEGERQSYTSYNEKGNKRRIYKYFEAVQAGDLLIGYESSPVKQIRAVFEVTKSLHQFGREGRGHRV